MVQNLKFSSFISLSYSIVSTWACACAAACLCSLRWVWRTLVLQFFSLYGLIELNAAKATLHGVNISKGHFLPQQDEALLWVTVEEIPTKKSSFTCLVRASSHRTGDHLVTISRQMDKLSLYVQDTGAVCWTRIKPETSIPCIVCRWEWRVYL